MGQKIEILAVSKKDLLEKKQEFADSDEEVWGWFCPIERRIYIYSGLEEASFKRVLLHELTHVLFAISGLTNVIDDKMEEAICDLNENMLDLFSNKEFLKEIN